MGNQPATFPWILDFRAAERRRGLAESSVDKRVSMVRRWAEYVDGDPFGNVSWRDVESFIDDSDMRAATSRYAAVSHLHQFYLWAMRAELVEHDPTALVIRPRLSPNMPRPAHDTDLALALAVATGPVLAAIVLMMSCGLRCVEVARLRWADVGLDAIRVCGKGSRERVLPLPTHARDALDELDRVDGYVFPWRVTSDIAPGGRVSRVLNRFFDDIGCETTAHQLRHWCATKALAATGRLELVQDYLGHASPATTRIYAKLDPTQLRLVADAIVLPVLEPAAAA